jgi:hypothetical protein
MSYTPYHAKPVLNIAPIVVPDSIIRAGVLPYDPKTGDDDLNKLRQMHRGTHAVARKGDLIVCLPRVENTPMVGKGPQEIRFRDNLGLVGFYSARPSSTTSMRYRGRSLIIGLLHSSRKTIFSKRLFHLDLLRLYGSDFSLATKSMFGFSFSPTKNPFSDSLLTQELAGA